MNEQECPQHPFDRSIDRSGTCSVKYDLRHVIFGKEDIEPMWVADMDFATPKFIRDAIAERLNHPVLGYTFRGEGYASSLAAWLMQRHGYRIQPETVCFSPGLVSALVLAVEAFTSPGDSVIVQPPVYHPFFQIPEKLNRRVMYNPLRLCNGRYEMDFQHLESIARQAKMIILCNPHNPVGRCWSPEELSELAQICLKNKVLILSDEIHSDLVWNGFQHTPMGKLGDEIEKITLGCYAPSKTFNLAALFSSAVVITDPALREKYNLTLERLHMQMGNLAGQVAFEAAYNKGHEWLEQLLSYLNQTLAEAKDFIERNLVPIHLVPTEATYLLWLDFRELNIPSTELNQRIIHKAGLGLSEGSLFGPGGEGFMRMNVACPRQKVIQALEKLKILL